MQSGDRPAAPLTGPSRLLRHAAALLVLLSVSWSVPVGRIGEDTKNDLFVDPVGLMTRALHLWDPQASWGGVQNQGYGYLFPMGPFFAGVGSVLPMWVTQRLWWTLLLLAGYAGCLWLLRALGVASPGVRSVAALSYVLAPRVVSTLGGLSSEALPQLLAPVVLAPIVLAGAGRLGPRRAAALSGVAILLCGGVNATATAFAALPTALWLLLRPRWWRSSLTWWWGLCLGLATAWFVGPLVLLGRYAPPFLAWIEDAEVVSRPVGLLDVARGTSHWLGHLVVAGGPWWPAGWGIVSSPVLIVATTLLAALSLVGLRSVGRHRVWCLTTLGIGVLLLALPHSGAVASPLAGQVQALLDGPLVPLRNIHKADPLVRLPLVVGTAALLQRLSVAGAGHMGSHAWRRAATPLAAVLVVVCASPGIATGIATRGTFTGMSAAWRQAGAWLDDHRDGRSLLVPAASFGEYTWGRTIDEPIRALTDAEYAVRDAIPLTPAGTIRLLDEVELRARTGRSLGGATAALRSAGVRYLVLRNDLDRSLTGGPPTAVARSALELTPGASRVAAFGRPEQDVTDTRTWPVEIWRLDGPVGPTLSVWPAATVPLVSGAAESLPALRDTGLVDGPVVFDSDVRDAQAWTTAARIETDGLRARERYFGAVRGQDATSGLDAAGAAGAADYLPAAQVRWRSTTELEGVAGLEASSSTATTLTFAGLDPASRPAAALDGQPETAWRTSGDAAPRLTLRFAAPRSLAGLRVTPVPVSDGVSPPTRVSVSNGRQVVESTIAAGGGPQAVGVPDGPADRLVVTILDTTRGAPAVTTTGIAEVALPGLAVREVVHLAAPGPGRSEAVVLTRRSGDFSGCVRGQVWRCLTGLGTEAEETAGLRRRLSVDGDRRAWQLSGSLWVDPGAGTVGPLPSEVRGIEASSVRVHDPLSSASVLTDSDPETAWGPGVDDATPTISLVLAQPTTLSRLRLGVRDEWLDDHAPLVVRVAVDGRPAFTSLRPDGTVAVPDLRGRRVEVTLLGDPDDAAFSSLEVSSLDLGRPWSPLKPVTGAPCGQGPRLTVAGRDVPTRVVASPAGERGIEPLLWAACGALDLPSGTAFELDVRPWRGASPQQVLLRTSVERVARSTASVATTLSTGGVRGMPPTRLEPGGARLLVLDANSNPGWRARLDGVELTAQVVDGFRQGWLVPSGAGGTLVVDYAPDARYRQLLLGGLAFVALLLGLLVRDRPRPGSPAPRRRDRRPQAPWGALVAVTGATLVAGWPGALVALVVAVLASTVRRSRPRWHTAFRVAVVGLPLLTAGAVQALWSPSALGGPVVEATTRLLTLASFAAVLVVGASEGRGPTHDRELDEAVAEPREQE